MTAEQIYFCMTETARDGHLRSLAGSIEGIKAGFEVDRAPNRESIMVSLKWTNDGPRNLIRNLPVNDDHAMRNAATEMHELVAGGKPD